MESNTRIFFFIILCFINSIRVWSKDASPTPSSSNVIAHVVNVKSRHDSKWMVAEKTARGWDVNVMQYVPKNETEKDIYVHMYTRNSPNSFQESLYESSLCDLLTHYPNSRFFPRDIAYMIIPGRTGICEIKEGKREIQLNRCLNAEVQQNPGIIFPQSNPYELLVDFLSKTLPDDQRFFRVNFLVGNKTSCTYGKNIDDGRNDKNSGDECSKVFALAKPLCQAYEEVNLGITKIVKGIGGLLF